MVTAEQNFGMRKVALIFMLASALSQTAHATMPALTPKPKAPSLAACQVWAAQQDDDAIYMWGTEEDGSHSRAVAIDRLTKSCMGQRVPAIVGFGSSAGFDAAYCRNHAAIKLCKYHQ